MTPIRRILLILTALAFAGCATPTKPNIPYSGPIPGLDKIAQRNPRLATELRKLPEIQDGISPSESTALEKIVEIYDRFPDKFDKAFEKMNDVGLPDVRKYCSPLQATFWLAEDGKLNHEQNTVVDYSLDKLLWQSWGGYDSPGLSRKEIARIIDIAKPVKDLQVLVYYYEDRGRYTDKGLNDSRDMIFSLFKRSRDIFPEEAKEIILRSLEEGLLRRNKKRWDGFITVTNRLNAPELVDYYINTNITYNFKSGSTRTPYSVFSWKLGDCDDLASFGHKALKRAGYKTFGRRAYNGPGDAHIGLGLERGDGVYFLVVDFSRRYGGKNRMSGPYNEIIEIDRMLGYGTRYSGRESFQF